MLPDAAVPRERAPIWCEPVASPRRGRWCECVEVEESAPTEIVLDSTDKRWWCNVWKFAGPGMMIAVTYVDAGSVAADLVAGSRFHCRLLWTVLFAHVCGYAFHVLVIKVSLATGRTLSEEISLEYPRLRFLFWFGAQASSIALDMTYIMCTAMALLILFDLPLFCGVLVSACDTIIFVGLQALGHRKIECFCVLLGGIAFISYFGELFATGGTLSELGQALLGFVPLMSDVSDREEPKTMEDLSRYLLITTSIVGASIRPPNYFLHSVLVQTRQFRGYQMSSAAERSDQMLLAVKLNSLETAVGMGFAFIANVIVIVAASRVYIPSHPKMTTSLAEMFVMFAAVLGRVGRYLFAVALLAGGQSASVTGTLASQCILEGFLNIRLRAWLKRLMTRLISVVPTVLIVYFLGADSANVIGAMQVFIYLVTPCTLIPILKFATSVHKMGEYQLSKRATTGHWAACAAITALSLVAVGSSLLDKLSPFTAWLSMGALLVPYVALVGYLAWKPARVQPDPHTGLAAASFASFLGVKGRDHRSNDVNQFA